jgi:glucose-6-phosphate 1-dehydrogenase
LALPPSVFTQVAAQIKSILYDVRYHNRLIVEKPFGRDLESSNALSQALAPLFQEEELYRIDHYLGKEMVKNIMTIRFSNLFFNTVWNRNCIANVQIVFKETLGVEGRGGYFDEFGIIRDVMQNHMLQMLTVVAMERPATLDAEDVRNEKVKVLRCIRPLSRDEVILGQYQASVDGSHAGYLDDETIPSHSNTPTFAMATLFVENERWSGVPFVLRCGKALNEQKAEIRIQFANVPGCLFPHAARNELVIRVQPNEAVYMKMMVKRPGFDSQPIVSDLDLSYADRYVGLHIPEAYEALIMDALRGDRSNFVRADELENAWRIFTPLLKEIEDRHSIPVEYPYGSRGPASADERLKNLGFLRHGLEYSWPKQQL